VLDQIVDLLVRGGAEGTGKRLRNLLISLFWMTESSLNFSGHAVQALVFGGTKMGRISLDGITLLCCFSQWVNSCFFVEKVAEQNLQQNQFPVLIIEGFF